MGAGWVILNPHEIVRPRRGYIPFRRILWLSSRQNHTRWVYLSSSQPEQYLALALRKVMAETKDPEGRFRSRYTGNDGKAMMDLYLDVCWERRTQRLEKLKDLSGMSIK